MTKRQTVLISGNPDKIKCSLSQHIDFRIKPSKFIIRQIIIDDSIKSIYAIRCNKLTPDVLCIINNNDSYETTKLPSYILNNTFNINKRDNMPYSDVYTFDIVNITKGIDVPSRNISIDSISILIEFIE
jgi:hypothetical protein